MRNRRNAVIHRTGRDFGNAKRVLNSKVYVIVINRAYYLNAIASGAFRNIISAANMFGRISGKCSHSDSIACDAEEPGFLKEIVRRLYNANVTHFVGRIVRRLFEKKEGLAFVQ
jgi:hypothetical protein